MKTKNVIDIYLKQILTIQSRNTNKLQERIKYNMCVLYVVSEEKAILRDATGRMTDKRMREFIKVGLSFSVYILIVLQDGLASQFSQVSLLLYNSHYYSLALRFTITNKSSQNISVRERQPY